MSVQASRVARDDNEIAHSAFARDVVGGLTARPKRLAPKYFYDATGSQLFELITQLPEYYPTRSELAILRDNAPAIARFLPENSALVEFGSGSSRKARILLAAAPAVRAYVPVDISPQMLTQEAVELRRDRPDLKVLPVPADFTQSFALPPEIDGLARAGFFPGSTIGNFDPHEAAAFLRHAGRMLGKGALLVIGVDLVKDARLLHAAYNDAAGVTAKFNLNLLARMRRELGAEIDPEGFVHKALFNAGRSRIEMHLVSRRRQKVWVCGRAIEFRAGESIHTENSYKYTVESFGALARGAGWQPLAAWSDADGYFSVQALTLAQ